MADKQVIREPQIKKQHKDVWVHNVERVASKVEHVAYRNGVEVLRKEQLKSDGDMFAYEEIPPSYISKRLVIRHPGGCGDEGSRPTFVDYGYQEPEVESLPALCQRLKEDWESTQDYINLKELISSMNDGTKVPITNIVCLALGSLHDCNPEMVTRSTTQLMALNTVREVLGLSNNIRCIAQDPAFSETDKELLKLQGYESVDDPAGFAAIDNGSLVFVVCGTRDLIDVISRGSWPALLILNKVMSREEDKARLIKQGVCVHEVDRMCPEDEEDQRLNMVAGCQQEPFPNESEGGNDLAKSFGRGSWDRVSIYWRKKDQ